MKSSFNAEVSNHCSCVTLTNDFGYLASSSNSSLTDELSVHKIIMHF